MLALKMLRQVCCISALELHPASTAFTFVIRRFILIVLVHYSKKVKKLKNIPEAGSWRYQLI